MNPADMLKGTYQPDAAEIATAIGDLIRAGMLAGRDFASGVTPDPVTLKACSKHLIALTQNTDLATELAIAAVNDGANQIKKKREPDFNKCDQVISEYWSCV